MYAPLICKDQLVVTQCVQTNWIHNENFDCMKNSLYMVIWYNKLITTYLQHILYMGDAVR